MSVKEKNESVKSKSINKSELKNDLISALKQDFATTVNKIYINSLQREVGFREITVLEQKTLSRVMIENESRKDVIFDAQCALINSVCLEDDFNIYDLTEFDRLKLLIAVYQANMFKNDVTFTCEHCGTANKYKLDFANVIARLDQVEVKDTEFNYENKNWKYTFTVAYPSVRYISRFHKANVKKYRGVHKTQIQSVDTQVNLDYVDLYIKQIILENKTTGMVKTVDIADYEPEDVEEIISIFPQDVLYSDNGILKYITEEYIKKINDSFDKQHCLQCGELHENTVNSSASFL